MLMAMEALRCQECGTLADPALVHGRFGGLCPACLISLAIGDAAPPGDPTSPPLPEEAARIDASTHVSKFIPVKRIGSGATGDVWKAWDAVLGRWVALKILHEVSPEERARFTREAETAAKVSHPNIAAIYEVGEAQGRHFLAMQYVDGVTLQKFPRRDRRLLVRLIRDAARAVGTAHAQDIVHRDLKPANLAVMRRPKERPGYQVYVLDFGLARPIEGGAKVTATGLIVGTPAYMPPEQARGEGVDGRADVYALGATLYELLTARPPFRGPNVYEVLRKVQERAPRPPRSIDSTIHRDLERVVLKALEKDPGRRYASAMEFAEDLDRYLEGEPVLAKRPGWISRAGHSLLRRKAGVAAVFATLGLAVTLALVVPAWRREAAARAGWEVRRLEIERARPHVEAGKEGLQRLRLAMREPYELSKLKVLAGEARSRFARALEAAPDHAEAYWGIAVTHAVMGEKQKSLEMLDCAVKADEMFAPAYLERIRLRVDDYEALRHESEGGVRADSQEARALREGLESDLRLVERHSKDYPQLTFMRAMFSFAHGRYEEALAGFGEYLTFEPGDALANYWQGHALFHLERHKEAVSQFDRALALDSGHLESLRLRAASLSAQGNHEEAILALNRAIERRPDFPVAIRQRGDAHFDSGHYQEAIADYTRAIELHPRALKSFFGRALAKHALGNLDEAISDISMSIRLDPRSAEGWYNRGTWKDDQGRHREAIDDLTQAIELDPGHVKAWVNRGVARRSVGEVDDAVADFTEAIRRNSRFAKAYFNRGSVLGSRSQFDEAIEDFTQLIAIEPSNWEGYDRRGYARLLKRDYDQAIGDLDEAHRLNSAAPHVLMHRGLAKEARGRLKEAITDFSRAIELCPGDPCHLLDRGRALGKAGLDADAIEDYLRADALKPGHGGTCYELAALYARAGQLVDALDWLEKSVRKGFKDVDQMERNPDLKSLRGQERYKELIERLKER